MAEGREIADQALLPVRNLLEYMPLGKVLFASDLEQRLATSAEEHKRRKAIAKQQKTEQLNNITLPTVR